ncbi:hypothetical protein DYB32_003386 [Aphanomyces invadans]|uniref:Glycolipid transfer protein domain-containing protein n=1 Tax=Aphanomyces invadans TaxID=157072 RepID=A0A418B162_9STRA|nr:hypothetical protein DYB32_003386 [Aphanomyces invadans]
MVNPSHQLHHLTKEMSKAVALNVDTTMRNRTKSSIHHAQQTNSHATSSGDEIADDDGSSSSSASSSSAESSPNPSPTALVSTRPLPSAGCVHDPKPTKKKSTPSAQASSPEALLMPGKAFLESFYMFLKQHAKSLRVRNPRLQVKLNPPCLHYLEGCFLAMLQPSWHPDNGAVMQWQARRDHDATEKSCELSGTNVNQGMSKTNRILKLAGYVLHVIDLSIEALPDTTLLPSTCNLSIFSSLLYLHVDGVPFNDIHHLPALRKQLIELHLSRTTVPSLAALLGEDSSSGTWGALKVLELVACGVSKLDPSLTLAPRLHTLNVAHNELQTLAHLENCPHLTVVNVSYNQLTSVAGAHRYLAAVASLDLSHNHLMSTSGLEKMFTLQTLDLAHNAIPTTGEVAYLVSLPLLHDLSLLGNPFFDIPYRVRVLELLGRGVVLDNAPWSPAELHLVDRQQPPTADTVHAPQDAVDYHHATQTGATSSRERGSTSSLSKDLGTAGSSQVAQDIALRASILCGLLVRLITPKLLNMAVAQVVAHVLAQWIWPTTDSMSADRDNYVMWTVAGLVTVVTAAVGPLYGHKWWRAATLTDDAMASTPLSPRLSFNTHQVDDDVLHEVASLDVLSTSLEVLVEAASEMPLHDFITMAGEIHKLLEFLGTLGSVALKPWKVDEAALVRVWTETGHDSNVTIQQLVRDDSARHDPRSITRTVLHMVPVLLFVRSLCLEMEKDPDMALTQCAAAAYAATIAKQNKHSWLVQNAVLSAMQWSPVTRTDLIVMWDDPDQDVEFKEQRLHAIGRMLDIVVVPLAKLRDVYNVSD